MDIHSKVLDENGNVVLQATTPINAENLLIVSKTRFDLARSKGEEWMKDAIPVFGQKLIKAGHPH